MNGGWRRVLAIGAHPDDVEVGVGGLLARLARAGARVDIAVVSTPDRLEERQAEARISADRIGAALTLIGGERLGRVEDVPMHELVRRLDAVVAASRPELVLTHSASDLHCDHRLVQQAALAALRRVPCDLFAFTSTPALNAASAFRGVSFADISETLEVKLSAVAAHASQVERGSIDPELLRDLARTLGRLAGVRYAECFEVLRLRV